jgi:hypothetical protein
MRPAFFTRTPEFPAIRGAIAIRCFRFRAKRAGEPVDLKIETIFDVTVIAGPTKAALHCNCARNKTMTGATRPNALIISNQMGENLLEERAEAQLKSSTPAMLWTEDFPEHQRWKEAFMTESGYELILSRKFIQPA